MNSRTCRMGLWFVLGHASVQFASLWFLCLSLSLSLSLSVCCQQSLTLMRWWEIIMDAVAVLFLFLSNETFLPNPSAIDRPTELQWTQHVHNSQTRV